MGPARVTNISEVKLSAASCKQSGICLSDLFPKVELLNISFTQFIACTCGKFVSSVSDNERGRLDRDFNSVITSSNTGTFAFADNIPVMRAGIPADLRVVEACSKMHCRAPYILISFVARRVIARGDQLPYTRPQAYHLSYDIVKVDSI